LIPSPTSIKRSEWYFNPIAAKAAICSTAVLLMAASSLNPLKITFGFVMGVYSVIVSFRIGTNKGRDA
jgi:hypothetical protein